MESVNALALHGIIISKRQLMKTLKLCRLHRLKYDNLGDAVDFICSQPEGPGKH